MREVERIDVKKTKEEKPVEFTWELSISEGWVNASDSTENYKRIVFLGSCDLDGDMFACYDNHGNIDIHKGHLNSGKY